MQEESSNKVKKMTAAAQTRSQTTFFLLLHPHWIYRFEIYFDSFPPPFSCARFRVVVKVKHSHDAAAAAAFQRHTDLLPTCTAHISRHKYMSAFLIESRQCDASQIVISSMTKQFLYTLRVGKRKCIQRPPALWSEHKEINTRIWNARWNVWLFWTIVKLLFSQSHWVYIACVMGIRSRIFHPAECIT